MMNKIQSFEQFQNEELNIPSKLRKAAAGVALGAGLALGSPQVTKAGTLAHKIEQTQPQKSDTALQFSQVIDASGSNPQEIQTEVYRIFNELRVKKFGQLSLINYANLEPASGGKIYGTIQYNIAPDGRRGVTNANITIMIKEGRLKILVTDFEFIHVGQQPNTAREEIRTRYRPMVGTAISQQARLQTGRILKPALGGFADVVGGIVGNIVQDVALRPGKPKQNFALGSATPVNVDKNTYRTYVSELASATDYLISLILEEGAEQDF